MFNEQLLIEILGWQSESYKEKEQIIPTLKQYLESLEDQSFTVDEDEHGNIYVTKGKADLYPCMVSHLDQVHKYNANKTIVQNGNYLLAFDGARQIGTGGDDLVGVFMCLTLLDAIDNIKIAFFLQEEIGCIGSNKADLSFFDDCMFIGQADRKGNEDFINHSNGVKLFDEEFSDFVKPFLDNYKYKECIGVATDAGALSKRNVGIACFNISCGYFNAHTSTEYVCISDVHHCYDLLTDLIRSADKRFIYNRPVYQPVMKSIPAANSLLYGMLFERFRKHPKYIKSSKMSYAYSLVFSFIDDLVQKYDKMIDDANSDYPYLSDILEEYLNFLDDEDLAAAESIAGLMPPKAIAPLQQSLVFEKDCQHRNVKYDNTMTQFYCMDCFSYVDDTETFYDQETLHNLGHGHYLDRGFLQ
jgi:tripeptide aminopeptidase